MKFIFQIFAAVALAAGNASALENGVLLSETFGEPHGDKYSDLDIVGPAQRVHTITVRSGERVNGVGINFTGSDGKRVERYHGGHGGDKNTLALAAGEFIKSIETYSGEKDGHIRIKFIRFNTSAGNYISGGNPTENYGIETARDGYQLGGFFGYCGKELDSVGIIWTSISPVS